MKDNTLNSSYMTIATVERVILGPVMLIPHEAGYAECPLVAGVLKQVMPIVVLVYCWYWDMDV